MLAGGADKIWNNYAAELQVRSSQLSALDIALEHLQVAVQLAIPGLMDQLIKDVKNFIATTPTTFTRIKWVHDHTTEDVAPMLRQLVASGIVRAILNGQLIHSTCKPIAMTLPAFHTDLMQAVDSPEIVEHVEQILRFKPLSVYQTSFLFAFSDNEARLRKSVVKNLVGRIKKGKVKGIKHYNQYRKDNIEFDEEMCAAFAASKKAHPRPGAKKGLSRK